MSTVLLASPLPSSSRVSRLPSPSLSHAPPPLPHPTCFRLVHASPLLSSPSALLLFPFGQSATSWTLCTQTHARTLARLHSLTLTLTLMHAHNVHSSSALLVSRRASTGSERSGVQRIDASRCFPLRVRLRSVAR